MLIISCHADTGFGTHQLEKLEHGIVRGKLDNFAGVYAVMQAYFSGQLTYDYLRIELTYDEEGEMEGAKEVLRTLRKHDVVMVVDVTGVPTQKDFVIEKCKNPALKACLEEILQGMSYDLYVGCEDPIANEDEVNVYSQYCPYTFMLALPCFGGDYNAGAVDMREQTLTSVAQAIGKIAKNFSQLCKKLEIVVS